MSHDENTINITDDEIRESIPCVSLWVPETATYHAHSICLPVGYSVNYNGTDWFRGRPIQGEAWDHAVARERARLEREAQPRTGSHKAAYLAEELDKATAMLSEVIRERDELRATLEAERSTRRATDMTELLRERDALKADLAKAVQERDYARGKYTEANNDRVRLTDKVADYASGHETLRKALNKAAEERDALRAELAKAQEACTYASNALKQTIVDANDLNTAHLKLGLERDALREKLKRVRGVQRYGTKWSNRDLYDGSSEVVSELAPNPKGRWVLWSDLAELLGEEGGA